MIGYRTGDDWDLSENGYHVLTLKTSFPHHEGVWSWGSMMDQMIMLVRNPRSAIPSYHTMRYELDYSGSWQQSYDRRNYTYTERPLVEEWERWRDRRFDDELQAWANFTEFWMTQGEKWVRDSNEYDYHCVDHLVNDGSILPRMLDCKPKAIIQFEKLYSKDEQVGTEELLKLASALDGVQHSSIIEMEARPCVYKEVMKRTNFYNPNRDGKGPAPEEKKFTLSQLTQIKRKIEEVKNKFNEGEWLNDVDAVTLVMILNTYINEVQEELDQMLEYYDATEAPTPSTATPSSCQDQADWYFNQDPAFTCALIQEGMCDTISDIFKAEHENGVTANDACCICGGGIRPEDNTVEATV